MCTYYSDELMHYGRKGMKWGQHIYGRLYRHKDGSLNSFGRKKAKKYAAKYKRLTGSRPTAKSIETSTSKPSSKPEQKSIKDMSDNELRNTINRLQLERQYQQLQPSHISKGKRFIDKVLAPAATDAGKQLLKEWMLKEGKKALGLPPTNNNDNNKKNKNK